jgi:hypothetical protein
MAGIDWSQILPMLGQTWPARLAQSAYGAFTLPGDVYQGKVNPLSDEAIGRSADLAGFVTGGNMPMAQSGALGVGGGKLAAPAIRSADAPLFDYSHLAQVPNVPQFDLPRAVPPKGVPAKVLEPNNPANLQRVDDIVAAGLKQGGMEWYNTEPLRNAYIAELGDKKGVKAFNDYIDAVAATSPDSKVAQNVRAASYYNNLRQNDMPMPPLLKSEKGNWQVPAGAIPNPYGARAQALHVQNMNNVIAGGLPILDNPKPPSFAENLKGNYQPVTIDRHNGRLIGFDPMATGAYGAWEPIQQQRAQQMGIAPAQYQAGGWIGGQDLTNMASGNDPFLKHVENRIAVTAEQKGMTKAEVLREFIRSKMPLLGLGGVAAGGALANQSGGILNGGQQ